VIYAFIIRTVVLDGNATAVVQSRLGNELSKLYKMSSIQNKIMLKILWLCFFVDTVYILQDKPIHLTCILLLEIRCCRCMSQSFCLC